MCILNSHSRSAHRTAIYSLNEMLFVRYKRERAVDWKYGERGEARERQRNDRTKAKITAIVLV